MVRLDTLEERWQRAHLEAYVSDENGIIILSSKPERRLKAVQALDDASRERLARSLQYHWAALEGLQGIASPCHAALEPFMERLFPLLFARVVHRMENLRGMSSRILVRTCRMSSDTSVLVRMSRRNVQPCLSRSQ